MHLSICNFNAQQKKQSSHEAANRTVGEVKAAEHSTKIIDQSLEEIRYACSFGVIEHHLHAVFFFLGGAEN